MNPMDVIAELARYPVAAFIGPDGNITLHNLTGFDDARCDRMKAEGFSWLGVMGVKPDGQPDFAPNGVVPPAVAFVIAMAYRAHVEALSAPASDYDFEARRYH